MKPHSYWFAFLVAVALGLGAMAWLTLTVLELDRARASARQLAVHEENVRLALWRMETALAPIIARESARTYLAYESFYNPERAYSSKSRSPAESSFVIPSALLEQTPEPVLVHFQVGPDNNISSPQVPSGERRELSIREFDNGVAISRAEQRLTELTDVLRYDALEKAVPSPDELPAPRVLLASRGQQDAQTVDPSAGQGLQLAANNAPITEDFWQGGQAQNEFQKSRNTAELNSRVAQQQMVQQRANPNRGSKGQWGSQSLPQQQEKLDEKVQVKQQTDTRPPQPPSVSEGLMKALWLDGRLLLARRVAINGIAYVQGCWLDWDRLRADLLAEVQDLLPDATLVPVVNGEPFDARRLATLPARLVPGPAPGMVSVGLSPVKVFLLLTWAALALAAGAMALLLAGAIRLSERRAAFVSAVTHELRTPLTTFRMYAEMLAEGMVPDPTKREHYLRTLCAESNRLSHLVENVLAYARLERGRLKSRAEQASVQGVVDRVLPRLEQRAQQAGMQFSVECGASAAAVGVFTDVSAVEQILFNLVDNACKYAARAEDKRIHFSVQPVSGFVVFRVWDHGPGIGREDERRLFRPFSKSVQRAAESAPGVGLGLALCRRLARQIGGRLQFVRMAEGACFELALPQLAAEKWQAA